MKVRGRCAALPDARAGLGQAPPLHLSPAKRGEVYRRSPNFARKDVCIRSRLSPDEEIWWVRYKCQSRDTRAAAPAPVRCGRLWRDLPSINAEDQRNSNTPLEIGGTPALGQLRSSLPLRDSADAVCPACAVVRIDAGMFMDIVLLARETHPQPTAEMSGTITTMLSMSLLLSFSRTTGRGECVPSGCRARFGQVPFRMTID